MKNKIFILLSVIIFLNQQNILAQNKCVDTFENKSLYTNAFKYIYGKISTPILGSDSSLTFCAGGHILQQNKNKTLDWKKQFSKIVDIRFKQKDNSSIALFNYEPLGSSNGDRGFTKINKDGNIVWAKKITTQNIANNNYRLINNTSIGKNDDIIFSALASPSSFNLVVIDSNADIIKINQTLNFSFLNNEYIKGVNTTIDNNNIYVAIITEKIQSLPRSITNYLLLLKINYFTGNLISKAYYNFTDVFTLNDPFVGNVPFKGMLYELFNFKSFNNNLHVAGRKATSNYDNNRFYSIKLDTNLNILNQHLYKYPININFRFAGDVSSLPSFDNNGNILFASIQDSVIIPFSTNNCYYFIANEQQNIPTQRKQNISETGLRTNGFSLNVVPYLKSNSEGMLMYHTNSSQRDSVIHIVDISKDIKPNNCMGSESNLLMVETPTYNTLSTPDIVSITPFQIILTPYNLSGQNEVIEEKNFCRQVSVCDTIKINGTTKHCLSTPTATFTLYKNPQCLRKVKWLIDTNAVKIINQPNDTTINVKFLRPFHGYIIADFEGCVLQDSFYIDVNMPMQTLLLGKDTVLCRDKTILLDAGAGFKTYYWQDGGTNQTFTATQTGKYFVTAIDSCDNIFKDTVIIKPMDTSLVVNHPNAICLFDTAVISVNSKLKNYSWSPVNDGLLNTNTLKLFPQKTTLFTVSGERFAGCTLSDTVLIMVANCPIYIYFPNAFTPNADNKNDSFKAHIIGKIEQFELNIFNRYGQLIFSTKNASQGWDGTIKGLPQNSNSFVWYCRYKMKNETIKFIKGTVILIR